MSIVADNKRAPRATGAGTASYQFAIGEIVRLKGDFMRRAQKVDIYRVVATLPPLGELPQYRIRSDEETHDRVTTEDRLERPVATTGDSASRLVDKTFATE